MKIIPSEKHPGECLLTPWLDFVEAARFLGISRSTFQRLQDEVLELPATGGNPTNRRYLAPVVTQWFETVAAKTNIDDYKESPDNA